MTKLKRKWSTAKIVRKACRLVVIDGMPITQAMQKVGYSESSAKHHQSVLLNHPAYVDAKKYFKTVMMDRHPKIFDVATDVVAKGMRAKSKSYFARNGVVTDERVDIDHVTRLKSVDSLSRIFGIVDQKEVGTSTTVNILQLVNQARADRGLDNDG